MSELKPCPFCGSKPEKVQVVGDSRFYYSCLKFTCPRGNWSTLEHWNTRPIEDALNARIAELEAALVSSGNQQGLYLEELFDLRKRIAELEGKIDQLTAHSDIERQDDKWIPEVQE